MKSFKAHVALEVSVTDVDNSEASLDHAVSSASEAIAKADFKEPFVFGEVTSATSWSLRFEFEHEAESPEKLFDELHRTSRYILEALGLSSDTAIALTQSAELVPA